MDKTRVIIYGCGVMGSRIAQVLFGKRSFEVVGAVDIAPELAGKDLGESFDPPQNKLTLHVRRDKLEYPYLEELYSWASQYHGYTFSSRRADEILAGPLNNADLPLETPLVAPHILKRFLEAGLK